jgi:hypothetical protein
MRQVVLDVLPLFTRTTQVVAAGGGVGPGDVLVSEGREHHPEQGLQRHHRWRAILIVPVRRTCFAKSGSQRFRGRFLTQVGCCSLDTPDLAPHAGRA